MEGGEGAHVALVGRGGGDHLRVRHVLQRLGVEAAHELRSYDAYADLVHVLIRFSHPLTDLSAHTPPPPSR